MFPSNTANNIINRTTPTIKHLAQLGLCIISSFVKLINLCYLVRCQGSPAAFLTFRISILCLFIGHVIIVSANPKMSRVATGRVIASVTNTHPGWNRAKSKLVGCSMSSLISFSVVRSSVTFTQAWALPFPTLIRACLLNLRPKFVLCSCFPNFWINQNCLKLAATRLAASDLFSLDSNKGGLTNRASTTKLWHTVPPYRYGHALGCSTSARAFCVHLS